MNVIFKTEGKEYIAYETTKASIMFGDDDLSINLKNRERDEVEQVDICSDKNGFLVIGATTGYRYVAQVEIPAREYTETEGADGDDGEATTIIEPVPFDIDKCTLYLWAMEV